MKKINLFKTISAVAFLFMFCNSSAQQKFSVDVAAIHNLQKPANGLNISTFWHFNEKLAGGIEVNRFFPVVRYFEDEPLQISAWDFDLNLHYLVSLAGKLKGYPLAGVSYTREKETNIHSAKETDESIHFFSVNAGWGLAYELGKWSPHVEYAYTWGHINQQFLLAGISYEIAWGHHKK